MGSADPLEWVVRILRSVFRAAFLPARSGCVSSLLSAYNMLPRAAVGCTFSS